MLIGAGAAFLEVFLRDLRFFLVFFLVAFFFAPTLRFFATRFLATRFFVVFFFAVFFFVVRFFAAADRLRGAAFLFVAVRFFADVLREDFFFARALDVLRVALANAHLLKAYALAIKDKIVTHYMN